MTYKTKMINKFFAAVLVAAAMTFLLSVTAFAASAGIRITGWDEVHKIDETGTVTVELTASEQIGTYYVELEYDPQTAAYVSGADSSTEGMIILTGTGTDAKVVYGITFKFIAEGQAGVKIKSAVVNDISGNAMDVTADASTLIATPDIPVIGSVENEEGQMLYILDQSLFVPDLIGWSYQTEKGIFKDKEVTFVTDLSNNMRILCMVDNDGNYYAYAVNSDDEMFLLNRLEDKDESIWLYTSSNAAMIIPDAFNEDPEAAEYAVYAINESGVGGMYNIDQDNNMSLWKSESKQSFELQPWMVIAAVAVVVIALIVVVLVLIIRKIQSRKKQEPFTYKEEYVPQEDDIEMEYIDLDIEEHGIRHILDEPKSAQKTNMESDSDFEKQLASIQLSSDS